LAHEFRGFSPRSIGSVAFGLCQCRTSWQKHVGEETVHLIVAKKQRERGKGHTPNDLTSFLPSGHLLMWVAGRQGGGREIMGDKEGDNER
jgi:hypothetical protein